MSDAAKSGSRLRVELIEIRQQLREQQDVIHAAHDRGLPSVQVCAKLTAVVDQAITRLFESALADQPAGHADRLRRNCSLVAHGGYGRRHMAPASDVDLMFLYEARVRTDAEKLAARLTQDIFDIGLQLGQSLRTVDEAVQLAKGDAVIGTSLIESRPLAGDTQLFDRFAAAFERMIQRRPKAMCEAFIAARRTERDKYGETVYLLEPNIKRSRGGLRDLHLLRWLWFVHTGVSDLDRLRGKGSLSKFDHRRLTSSRDFLLRVRNDAHFNAGKSRDLLDRGEQVRLAEKLGYRGLDGMRPVEQFMRDYFRHASHIWFLTARVIELSSPRPVVSSVIGAVFGRNIEKDYQIDSREITATPAGRSKLTTRLDETLRLVDLARLSDRRISQDTWYLVYRSAPKYGDGAEPKSRERFLDLMDNPAQLGGLLRRLHDLGVLEKVIPEFAHARCLLQFNQYHKFTVDEHCIRTVEEATRFAERDDRLGEVYRNLENKRLLHLALLLHDLGKGHEEDHSVLGEQIADTTAERLQLTPRERDQLKFLVRQHLWMSHLALRRDTGDPEMVASFATEVGSLDTLQMLYVLTCADLAGVGPGVLNGWKVQVLTDLYAATRELLRPGGRLRVGDRRNALRIAVLKLLPPGDRDDSWLKRQFNALPESLIRARSPGQIVQLLRKLEALKPREATAWGETLPESGAVEFIAGVSQGLGRGVFCSMAGALSSAGLPILSAETIVLEDNLLLLRYVVDDPASATQDLAGGRISELSAKLVASVDDLTPPTFPRMWGADQQEVQARLTNLPHEVRIDTELSEQYLIVEVFASDRGGLLFDLASTVHELGLVIRFAKVATSADQVVDAFYVTEPNGAKPAGAERLEGIRQRLLDVIKPPALGHQ